jgi:hypothetical protein
MTVTLINERKGTEKTFDTRSEAQEKKQDMIALGMDADDLKIVATNKADDSAKADGGQPATQAAPVEDTEVPVKESDIPDEPPAIDQDPVSWLPEHFVDTIQGVPTVNRKGYAVIASKYEVAVTSNAVTLPSETDFEYAEFEATAVTKDGREYSGFGSAHIDRQDGDDPHLLAELAETRAMKRATAWATGVGMTAASEMMNNL